MSGDAAAGTLVEIKVKQLERGGKKLSEEDKKELYESTKRTYDEQTDPRYGAASLWIDKIIDPIETRKRSRRPSKPRPSTPTCQSSR
jgi:3-methylcrotonyl-CoA carboxylase beta subunit